MPSVEVAIEKLVQAVTCIVRCLAIVFQPVIKQGRAGLEMPVIKSMIRAGIDNELDRRPVVAPEITLHSFCQLTKKSGGHVLVPFDPSLVLSADRRFGHEHRTLLLTAALQEHALVAVGLAATR